MRVRRLGRGYAPIRPVKSIGSIRPETVAFTQRSEHSPKGLRSFRNRDQAPTSPHRNPDKAELGNCRGQEQFVRGERGNPRCYPGVLYVVGPAPSDQDIDIDKVVHGKSAESSFTASLVNGG